MFNKMSYDKWIKIIENYELEKEYKETDTIEYKYFIRRNDIVISNKLFYNISKYLKIDSNIITDYMIDVSAYSMYNILKDHIFLRNKYSYKIIWIFGFLMVYKYSHDSPYNNKLMSNILNLEILFFNKMEKYYIDLNNCTFPLSYNEPFHFHIKIMTDKIPLPEYSC